MVVKVMTGLVAEWCDLVVVGECEATPQAVSEVANVPVEVAARAIEKVGEVVLAGWWDGDRIVQYDEIPEDWEEVDQSRYGDPIFKDPNRDELIEPFYVRVLTSSSDALG